MSIEKFKPSYDMYKERFEKLKEVIPEAFVDEKINWDIVKESLANFLEEEDSETEHYQFTWPGKRQARRLAGKPPQGTLIAANGEGVNEEKTENIFIEGDNLEVLKLLQKSYASKIKMIYIDPPYNTGNDFIYNDNFTQPLEEYLKLTGQIDETGNPLVSNKKSDGRFHSKWLNMIYPRLSLARNLLKDDGVIFISIDDNEVDNLKKICNEVFGEENFVATIIWQKKYSPQNDAIYFSNMHDFIICYAKNRRSKKTDKDGWVRNLLPRTEEANARYKNPDNDPRGNWKPGDFTAEGPTPNCIYTIVSPKSGKKFNPPKGKRWVFNKENYDKLMKDNRIWFGEDGNNIPSLKRFKDEVQDGFVPNTIWFYKDVGHTQEGKQELNEIFEGIPVFDYPKPMRLIKRLVEIGSNDNDIVLDFFAGTCPLAHAALEISKESLKKRRFICIQLPEMCDKDSEAFNAGYNTIADIGKERIRRVIKKIDAKNESNLGFKVFKLKNSNFTKWENYEGKDQEELVTLFSKQENTLIDNWNIDHVIIEIMFLEGFPLHSRIEGLQGLGLNNVFKVSSQFCEHYLFLCLDVSIKEETITALSLSDKDIFICLDSALTDQQKVSLSDKGSIKTI